VVVFTAEALNERIVETYADADVVSPFVNSKLDAGILARLPRLKLIATRSTGYDHIDLVYCRAHGITVCNVPDYGDSTVAEHVFALLLAISRHLIEAVPAHAPGRVRPSWPAGVRPEGAVAWRDRHRADRPARDRDRQGLWHERPGVRYQP
jgi:D-lactate dehydrogenase